MDAWLIVGVPVVVLAVVLLAAFSGCTLLVPLEEHTAVASAYPEVVRKTPGLVSYWRLNETPGTSTAEDTGTLLPHHAGTYAAGVTLGEASPFNSPGPGDKSALFDGAQAYVEVGYAGTLNPPGGFAVEAWIKPQDHPANVIVAAYALAPSQGFTLIAARPAGKNPQLVATLFSSTGPHQLQADLGDGTQLGGWRHVVMSYQQPSKQLTLYVNSISGDPAVSASNVDFTPNQTAALRIGASFPPNVQHFAGLLAEIALYQVPLVGSDIKEHFKAATS